MTISERIAAVAAAHDAQVRATTWAERRATRMLVRPWGDGEWEWACPACDDTSMNNFRSASEAGDDARAHAALFHQGGRR